MRILSICGSLRSGSYNLAILEIAKSFSPAGVKIISSKNIGLLPFFNPDVDMDHPPEIVGDFLSQIRDSEGLLIASPEYAHGIPGVLKNALDWLVGSQEIINKPVGVITASPSWTGAIKAQDYLIHTLTVISAKVVSRACLSIPAVNKKFDAKGILEKETSEALMRVIEALAAVIKRGSIV